jgi:hypothetical protein
MSPGDHNIHIHIEISRRRAAAIVAAALLCAGAVAMSENLTMTTYYPSPSGVYRKLVSTTQTILARDSGRVGIGTTAPSAAVKLDVAGPVRVGNAASDPAGAEGAIYYNTATKKFRGFQNGAWKNLSSEVNWANKRYESWWPLQATEGVCYSCHGVNRHRCPLGYAVTAITWYEGVNADSDAGDNIGIECSKIE